MAGSFLVTKNAAGEGEGVGGLPPGPAGEQTRGGAEELRQWSKWPRDLPGRAEDPLTFKEGTQKKTLRDCKALRDFKGKWVDHSLQLEL